ncbi:MAG: cell division protein SepF [Bacillaceae bacterium]
MSIGNRLKKFFYLEDEEQYEERERYEHRQDEQYEQQEENNYQKGEEDLDLEISRSTKNAGPNVVPITDAKTKSKVVILELRSYNEVQGIADQLLQKRAVIINLQRVQNDQARRIVDFLTGTIYAINGDMQKLDTHTFLCTPSNVSVSGGVTELYEQQEQSKRW